MPLYPLPWQDTAGVMGQERQAVIDFAATRLRLAQELLVKLGIDHELRLGAEAVVADMLALKAELESHGFMYTLPDHLKDHYDENFAPVS